MPWIATSAEPLSGAEENYAASSSLTRGAKHRDHPRGLPGSGCGNYGKGIRFCTDVTRQHRSDACNGGTIFRVRRNIYLLGPKGLRLLQRASGTPIGLSIEGRRIAWAVNIKGRGRIVALTLPR